MLVPRIEKLRPTELFRLIKKHKELPPIFGKAKVREFSNRKNNWRIFLDAPRGKNENDITYANYKKKTPQGHCGVKQILFNIYAAFLSLFFFSWDIIVSNASSKDSSNDLLVDLTKKLCRGICTLISAILSLIV
jgi:hypothetical protein